ncbi:MULTISPECIES: DUF6119 family protein [unclassified Pseudoxanthomonas]|uniref:DUF6119 family protein n=1 Tax=unclassified Pseudoxanthomonas TaxID=2645906 RepID=UPI003077A996
MKALNIRLLRRGRSSATAFGDSFAPGAERELQLHNWQGEDSAALYVGQIYSNPPAWRDFLQSLSGPLPEELFTGGAGAVLFLPVGQRTVAVCFGHVHIALDDDAFERGFGLRVTLNSVPRGQLRTLDLATPDAVTFQKRIQASMDSDVQEFGVDMLRDLARVAGGTPSDRRFARFVAGKDTLSITCDVEPETIGAKCTEVMAVYRSHAYKRDYAWVDNMRVIKERDILNRLDAKLFRALEDLREGRVSDLHMAPPEVVNYTEGSLLHYNGFGSHGTNFTSLSIDDYVDELNKQEFHGDISEIKDKHRIRAMAEGSGAFSEKWRVYDCFVFETTVHEGGRNDYYVMFAGDWYFVKRTFRDRVEAFFDSIEKVSIIGPTTCLNERELIASLDGTRDDLLNLDQRKINPAGVRYANLEPCDFLSRNREFIHLKDGHSSGPISHLWSQGVVSAEAFVSDADFRAKLREEVRCERRGFETLLPNRNATVTRTSYKVVFGIMRKPYADGTLGLPFFSKVSLQAAAERIAQFGLPMAIELIQKPASDAETQ